MSYLEELKGNNMDVYLDGKRKDNLLPFIDLEKFENIIVESIKSDIKLHYI